MSLVTKPSRRRSIDIAVSSNIHNHPEYPEYEKGAYLSHTPQKAGWIAKEALTKVPIKYVEFAFFSNLASKLPKHTGINNYAIKLVNANGFIKLFKSLIRALIFFNRKSDGSLWLCIDYRGFYNVSNYVSFNSQGSLNSHHRSCKDKLQKV